jgi:hypothetical protein
MTVLRQRMIEDMQLRGLAARTQEAYVARAHPACRCVILSKANPVPWTKWKITYIPCHD